MSSFWGTQPKEEEKKTPIKEKKGKSTVTVEEPKLKPEEKDVKEKKEEEVKDEEKKTPLIERKAEPQTPLREELPEGVLESTPVSTIIKLKDIETRKFMHLNLDDFISFDENCLVKIRGVKFSINNWNELKCKLTSLAYTNTPLVDDEISEWCVEDFVKTMKTTEKTQDFVIDDPKCLYVMRSDKDVVDPSLFHSLRSDEKKIVKSDQQAASEILYLRGKEASFSLGTCMFSVTRNYEGDICIYAEVSVLYEKKPF